MRGKAVGFMEDEYWMEQSCFSTQLIRESSRTSETQGRAKAQVVEAVNGPDPVAAGRAAARRLGRHPDHLHPRRIDEGLLIVLPE